MPVAYPENLPKFTSSIEEESPFTMSDPIGGPGYVRPNGTDQPVTVVLRWQLPKYDLTRLWLWLRSPAPTGIALGLESFTAEINTPAIGMVEHELAMLPQTISAKPMGGDCYSLELKFRARELIVPDAWQDAAPLIVGLENWHEWMPALDIGMSLLPE